MAVAIAFSSKVARLCTMPIQFPETCTTARWLSIRTSRACCDSSMRVEGSSRLARICCQSSPRSSLGAGVVAATSAGGSDVAAACEGGEWVLDVSGRLTAGTAVEESAVEVLAVEATAGAGAGAGVGAAAGAAELTRAGAEVAALVGAAGSASKPSSSTSSQSRGCTL
ncbi:MAG: Uncharacterised protein [Synechococcus sp. MIT S9220]|nr:MAG: Uncharacterised protein [Synechococcus sp. MIT S9220]